MDNFLPPTLDLKSRLKLLVLLHIQTKQLYYFGASGLYTKLFKTCASRVFIGLAIMQMFIYTILYKYGKRSCMNFFGILIVIVLLFSIPLALAGYKMIIANSTLRGSLAIYHLHLLSQTRAG